MREEQSKRLAARRVVQEVETMEVPTKTTLADIYPEDALKSQTKRWNSLISTFKDRYGKLPEFVSRSPGRVNIIGEVSGRVLIHLFKL